MKSEVEMVYDIKKAAELLGISVEDVEENIRRGTITAEWKDGRWEIPDWSIRVFVRTREALRKLNRRAAFEREESEYDLLMKIVAKLEELTDLQTLQSKWIEQLDTLRFRIREFEEELRQIREELELQRSQPEEWLKRLEEHHRETINFIAQETAQLLDRIASMEEELKKIQWRGIPAPVSSPSKNPKESFWDRLVKMLTWD